MRITPLGRSSHVPEHADMHFKALFLTTSLGTIPTHPANISCWWYSFSHWGGLEHLIQTLARYVPYQVKLSRKRTFHHFMSTGATEIPLHSLWGCWLHQFMDGFSKAHILLVIQYIVKPEQRAPETGWAGLCQSHSGRWISHWTMLYTKGKRMTISAHTLNYRHRCS